jgi:3-oxoacyl-[acyl-carrier protein] reductase
VPGALAGRVAVVTGAGLPVVRGIAAALGAAGASVALVGASRDLEGASELEARGVRVTAVEAELSRRADAEAAFAAAKDALGAPVDALVHGALAPIALEPCDLVDHDDERWGLVWETTMRTAISCCQAAFAQMHDRGGRILFVLPTSGLSGAVGFASSAAAFEGERLLVKSLARQWGQHGIVANCLVVSPDLVLHGASGVRESLSNPALGWAGDPERDLGPIAVAMLSSATHFLTGNTVVADGGVRMGAP